MVANLLTRKVKSAEARAVVCGLAKLKVFLVPDPRSCTNHGHLERFWRGFMEVRASLVSGLFPFRQMKLML